MNKIAELIRRATQSINQTKIAFDSGSVDLEKMLQRHEEEKNKDESTKIHEKWLRKIKRSEIATKLDVKPAKKEKQFPGSQFEGNLQKLIEKYKTIDEVFKHMTLGQLQKYSVIEENKIVNIKSGNVAYDGNTGEIFE